MMGMGMGINGNARAGQDASMTSVSDTTSAE